MKKRGINSVVATVLILLIVIMLIALLWAFLMPLIREKANIKHPLTKISIVTTGGYTAYDTGMKSSCVQIENQGDDLEGVQIIYVINGNSHSYKSLDALKKNQVKTYCFDLLTCGKPGKIIAAPIYEDKVTGDSVSTTDIASGDLKQFASSLLFLDASCNIFAYLKDYIVSYYQFEGDVIDRTGRYNGSYVGNYSNAAAACNFPGRNGIDHACRFTGVAGNDYIELGPSNQVINNNDSWAMSVWFNPEDIPSDNTSGRIITLHRLGTFGTAASFLVGDNNRAIFRYYDSSENWHNVEQPAAISIGKWYFFAVSYNKSQNKYIVELNDSTYQFSDTFFGFSTHPAFVGAYDASANFKGTIDELMFFNRSLNATEMNMIYNAQKDVIE